MAMTTSFSILLQFRVGVNQGKTLTTAKQASVQGRKKVMDNQPEVNVPYI
jgi:hypothetical protein